MNWKTENWETLSPEGDKEIHNIFTRFTNNEIILKKLFYEIEDVPKKFEDAELCKETTNKVIDHLVHLGYDEEETVDLYHVVRNIANMDESMDVIQEDIKRNISKTNNHLNDIDELLKD